MSEAPVLERLGVSLAPSRQIPISAVVELAQRAEELGYDSIWVPETWGHDAVSILAVLARETGHVRLAAGVFNVFSRSAVLIAQTAAALQGLSHGRFLLGLGASGPIVVQDWHGVSYDRPIERTREYVQVIRLALAGERVHVDGQLLRLRNFRLLDPPSAATPIYLAALGPRNVRLAGEIADGWLPIFAARGHMHTLLEMFKSGAIAVGRDPAELDAAAYIPALLGLRSESLLRQQIAYYVGGMGTFYAQFVSRIGFGQEAAQIRDRWQGGDRRGAVEAVDDRLLEFCSVGGSAAQARDRLAAYREEGIHLPILVPPHGCSRVELEATLEELAPIHRP